MALISFPITPMDATSISCWRCSISARFAADRLADDNALRLERRGVLLTADLEERMEAGVSIVGGSL